MDGTLLRSDGTVDDRDVAAVSRAMRSGVIVTIATGRVATGTLPTARQLGLDAPLVCADGGLIVSATTGERLVQQGIALRVAESLLGVLREHSLVPFVLLPDSVHCDESGRAHAEYVSVWTTAITVHADLHLAEAWRLDGEIALAVGIGEHDAVERAMATIRVRHDGVLDLVRFRIARTESHWALLARPHGCSKGAALARIAGQLGVAHEDTAVVGDWYNDVPMFQWAARSFAMGQAPDPVRSAATDVLEATVFTGGGVAEAIARWIGPA
jgi:HAD superfamily hydrolase (TIGR01484 family)